MLRAALHLVIALTSTYLLFAATSPNNFEIWAGNVTDDGLTISVLGSQQSLALTSGEGCVNTKATLVLRDGETISWTPSSPLLLSRPETNENEKNKKPERFWRFHVAGLSPSCCINVGSHPDEMIATFCTFGKSGVRQSTRIAFGSCDRFDQDTTSTIDPSANLASFAAIASYEPEVFVHMGDLHYRDLASQQSVLDDPDPERFFLTAYSEVLGLDERQVLLRSVAMDYVWNDHDYGLNDGAAATAAENPNPLASEASQAYDKVVPHYPLPAGAGSAKYHAFTIHTVRVVVLDVNLEARASPNNDQIVSERQFQWLEGELAPSARDRWDLVLLVIVEPLVGGSWGEGPQRKRLFRALQGATNVMILAGDNHMLAMDSGTNYGGVPVVVAGPLGNSGSAKGGAYDAGCFSYVLAPVQQFVIVDVLPDRTVQVRGIRSVPGSNIVLIDETLTLPFPPAEGDPTFGQDACNIPLLPATDWVAVFLFPLAVTLLLALAVYAFKGLETPALWKYFVVYLWATISMFGWSCLMWWKLGPRNLDYFGNSLWISALVVGGLGLLMIVCWWAILSYRKKRTDGSNEGIRVTVGPDIGLSRVELTDKKAVYEGVDVEEPAVFMASSPSSHAIKND